MRILSRVIAVLFSTFFTVNALASDPPWPGKQPVRIIVPFAAGGATDIVARQLAKILNEQTKQIFIVENRGGASGEIGAMLVSRADPDGYTLLLSIGSYFTITPYFEKLQHDPLKDLTPITDLARGMLVLVGNPSFPPKNLKELVQYVKQSSQPVSYGSFGLGTVSHLSGEMLNILGGIKMTHIAYRGSAPGLSDVLAGHIQLMFDTVTNAGPSIKDGRVRAYAVNSVVRNTAFPDIPTFRELGYPEMELFAPSVGMFGPKDMSAALANEINRALIRAMATKEYQDRLQMNGSAPGKTHSPEAFRQDIVNDAERLEKFIKANNIRGE